MVTAISSGYVPEAASRIRLSKVVATSLEMPWTNSK